MFAKILIANRGEIACRIIKTARRLGVRTVAVYSETDTNARHVRLADEAVCIGAAAAQESYLSVARIIAAAKQTGADALHPGYGFLSENAAFAQACLDNDIIFIGPPVSAIAAMGSKSAAKALMERANVPLTPGYHGDDQDEYLLAREAKRIGYPIIIKASAGGGGKGMRVVERSEGFAAALLSCQREAKTAFDDDRVLIEKYLTRPRHIEVQVFGDQHGNLAHLFERDCSVQRRHQKIVEEAPAPNITAQFRAALGAAAVAAARAVGFVGAGTVEFILPADAADATFYFMEMNTRLQVEHPVTEMITGLDLVEWQLRVAAGEALPLTQEQITLRGHALEARLYAEDPNRDFLPSSGRLSHLALPQESLNVRVDSGVEAGDEITPHYDPMMAKLIVWDETRERACIRMQQALAACRIVGVANNVGFLSRLFACPAFAQADLDTGLIEREQAFLFPLSQPAPLEVWYIAALAEVLREQTSTNRGADPYSPWQRADGWRMNSAAQRTLRFRLNDEEHNVRVAYLANSTFKLSCHGQEVTARGRLAAGERLQADLGGRILRAEVLVNGERRHVFLHGCAWPLAAVDALFHAASGAGPVGGLTAPMPGKVVALLVASGAQVVKGTPLLILEAMKMEHNICAPANGVVKNYRYEIGDQVTDGAELVEFVAAK